LRLVKDAMREHKTHLSCKGRTAVEKCYSVMARELNGARKLAAEAAKCPTGMGIPPKLAAIESCCDAIVAEVRKAKAAMRL
jgi:hypothetical protein